MMLIDEWLDLIIHLKLGMIGSIWIIFEIAFNCTLNFYKVKFGCTGIHVEWTLYVLQVKHFKIVRIIV